MDFGTAPYYPELQDLTFALARRYMNLAMDIRHAGTAAWDLCLMAQGSIGIFYELKLEVWDFAAGALIAEEAGCRVTDAAGLPLTILQWVGIILWITKGIWWVFLVWVIIAIPYGTVLTRWYFRKVSYICPQCHTVFKPTFKEAFWANHTPATRKLTCPHCGHHGFCVEVAAEEAKVTTDA